MAVIFKRMKSAVFLYFLRLTVSEARGRLARILQLGGYWQSCSK